MPIDWTAARLESIVALADMQTTALRLESLVTLGDGTSITAMRLENIVSSEVPATGGIPPLQGQEQHLHYGLQGHTGGVRKGPGPLF